jgi:hypothetical protein
LLPATEWRRWHKKSLPRPHRSRLERR